MAEENEEVEGAAEGEESSGGGKKKLLPVGGVLGVIAAGALAAVMAIPSKEETPRMVGPYAQELFEDEFSCNLQGKDRTRFLQMKPQVSYLAYDPLYLATRTTDPLYAGALRSAVFGVSSRKNTEEIWEGDIGDTAFAEELRDNIDPILFPVHVGNTQLPWDHDEESGLRPGLSASKTTFRGHYEKHLLHVTQEPMEMWVDEGPKASFEKGDEDIRLITVEGNILFIDASLLKDEFEGEVKIGIRGRIIQVIPVDLLVQ